VLPRRRPVFLWRQEEEQKRGRQKMNKKRVNLVAEMNSFAKLVTTRLHQKNVHHNKFNNICISRNARKMKSNRKQMSERWTDSKMTKKSVSSVRSLWWSVRAIGPLLFVILYSNEGKLNVSKNRKQKQFKQCNVRETKVDVSILVRSIESWQKVWHLNLRDS
jgi:thymidylate synthase